MKSTLAILALLLLIPGISRADAIATAGSSAVEVTALIIEGEDGIVRPSYQEICSGFVVSGDAHRTVIATAKHCTHDDDSTQCFLGDCESIHTQISVASVTFMDGQELPVTKVVRCPDRDCAFLVTGPHNAGYMATFSPMDRGQHIFVMGSPVEGHWAYSDAYSMQGDMTQSITVQDEPGKDYRDMRLIDCPSCFEGDSGAGVYDFDGNVVGLLVAGTMGIPERTWIVPAAQVVDNWLRLNP